jgi:hypothetical protein
MGVEEPLAFRQLEGLVNDAYVGSYAREVVKQMRARFRK